MIRFYTHNDTNKSVSLVVVDHDIARKGRYKMVNGNEWKNAMSEQNVSFIGSLNKTFEYIIFSNITFSGKDNYYFTNYMKGIIMLLYTITHLSAVNIEKASKI